MRARPLIAQRSTTLGALAQQDKRPPEPAKPGAAALRGARGLESPALGAAARGAQQRAPEPFAASTRSSRPSSAPPEQTEELDLRLALCGAGSVEP